MKVGSKVVYIGPSCVSCTFGEAMLGVSLVVGQEYTIRKIITHEDGEVRLWLKEIRVPHTWLEDEKWGYHVTDFEEVEEGMSTDAAVEEVKRIIEQSTE